MSPELAYMLGGLTVAVSQIVFVTARGLIARHRARKRGPIQQRAIAAVEAGEVVEVTQNFDGEGQETVIRLVARIQAGGRTTLR